MAWEDTHVDGRRLYTGGGEAEETIHREGRPRKERKQQPRERKGKSGVEMTMASRRHSFLCSLSHATALYIQYLGTPRSSNMDENISQFVAITGADADKARCVGGEEGRDEKESAWEGPGLTC